MESVTLADEWSPVADIEAFVERSDKNYYFYLWINPFRKNRVIRACWICNRVKAPKDIDEAFACDGEAPCMPEEFVDHDPNGIELDDDALSIQWFEEGDSGAVLLGDIIIAVIPCFAGYKGFYGYSVFAKGTGPFAWELKGAYDKFDRQAKVSAKFWDYFEDENLHLIF